MAYNIQSPARKAAVGNPRLSLPSISRADAPPILGRSSSAYLARVIARHYDISPSLATTIAEIIRAGVRP